MMEETDPKDDEMMWQMRNTVIQEDDSNEWKKRRSTPLSDLNNLARKATLTQAKYAAISSEATIKIMASLVPDEIIYNIGDYSKREFDGCLLFGDVSGFTDLCEKYNKSGKGGPSRLTQVLNNYIGAMVQEILSHSGDVLEFSGDAFIALWKVTDHLSMRDAVHEAIDCSLVIQKTYGTYHTDVDVVVRVKLAVASGHLVFSLVGDEESSHYLMNGKPIFDLKAAEELSSAGEIVITARVSHHISANEYLMDVLPDGLHAKVLGVGPNWRNIQRQFETKDAYSINENEDDVSYLYSKSSVSTVLKSNIENIEDDIDLTSRGVTDQYALRPAVNHAARQKMKFELRRFIIAPVVRGIDAEEPLEYLTEIRQVAILFINCKVLPTVGAIEGIDVAHEVYVTVCNAVKNRYGCVNKINNFDKDLMLLVIFGLRGFKHEMESQIALKCATECFQKINSMKTIQGVGAGVTTGKCYCGAFGHTLRREYTVIGLVVNKAARLMMAYPNKVTCDRETFLHSKLEARNFVLQERKHLKGIINPGPIYEFKEIQRTHDLGASISALPLLGREQEMDLYQNLLRKAKHYSKKKNEDSNKFYTMMVIQGDYRQGKTRLLEEMLFSTDPRTPINTLTLTSPDQGIPYRIIRLIFRHFIGLPSNSSPKERKDKIRARIRSKLDEKYYVYLNEVFSVDFDGKTPDNPEKKLKNLRKVFTVLCHECFVKLWIIAIDEAAYIDDSSWMLFGILLDLNKMFIAATIGAQKEITTCAIDVLKHERIKIITLKPIDRWYHIGLACQMLDIEGVPPELEKTIQQRSNGNPGWIESFLVTVMQSGGLNIDEIKRIRAYNSGLVIVPLYMIMRMSQEETDLWMEIMEEKTFENEDSSKRWKMFVDSCRESYPDLSVAKRFEEKLKYNKLISICTLNPKFNLDDVEPGYYIDVVILKIFDSLTSYEQLLLKCSSILGDIFPRDMLLYIMSSSAVRLTALAVQKLFEIQVLSCAKGNFIEGGLNFKDRLVNPNDDMTVKCDCKGLIIDETCSDLPKYASCGYLRFRSSEFRETTYNLLTDNQKREFHERAIRYLEKETRRCRACGNGYFVRRIGGTRIDEGLRAYRTSRPRPKASVSQLSDETETRSLQKMFRKSSHTSYTSMQSTRSRDWTKRDTTHSTTSAVSDSMSLGETGDELFSSNQFGFTTIRKLKDNFNLARTFSGTDYSLCTCLLVLNTMYSQLIEHCKGAGLVEKIMNATIEYSYVCFENRNAPQAIKVLEEALQLLEGPMRDQIELEWMVELKKGKLFALLGQARMNLQDDDAYIYFINALKCYGITFPKGDISKRLLKSRYKLKQKMKLYLCPNIFSTPVDEDIAEYCNNVSECLSFLCGYFMKKDMWKEAELAAIWSLNKAVESETDFEKMCIAYGNMIYVAASGPHVKICIALEVFALKMCHRKKTNVELEELKAVTYLYFTIGRSRFLKSTVDRALHMAYILWRVSTSSQNSLILMDTLPFLAHLNLLKKQVTECGTILQEMAYLTDLDVDNTEKTWYYALCIMMHLETGLIAQPLSKCYKYIQGQGLDVAVMRDRNCKKRLIIIIWLWEIRNENWEAAICWENLAWDYHIKQDGETLQNLISGLYLLEGLLIYMVNKMDMKNLQASARAERKILVLFEKLTQTSKFCKWIVSRLYHLRAYYTMSKYSDFKMTVKLLRKGMKAADKQNNELEMAWMQHNELAWSNKLPKEEMYFWRNHSDEENYIDYRDLEANENFIPYTLPLPIYL